jgi:hypothetical protein
MTVHLVETSDEDSFQAVAQYIAGLQISEQVLITGAPLVALMIGHPGACPRARQALTAPASRAGRPPRPLPARQRACSTGGLRVWCGHAAPVRRGGPPGVQCADMQLHAHPPGSAPRAVQAGEAFLKEYSALVEAENLEELVSKLSSQVHTLGCQPLLEEQHAAWAPGRATPRPAGMRTEPRAPRPDGRAADTAQTGAA